MRLTCTCETACRFISGPSSKEHEPDENVDERNSNLEALAHCLEKGKTWASENNVDVDTLIEKRIHPDMNVSFGGHALNETAPDSGNPAIEIPDCFLYLRHIPI